VHYGATLNQIILKLTNDETVDAEFLSMFFSTYLSFTSPLVVLQKLLQRYHVPSGKVPEERATTIRLRVGIVIKYWIENQFDDFDKQTITILSEFINKTLLKNNQEKLSRVLSKEMAKKIEEQQVRRTKYLQLNDLKVNSEWRSPSELFLVLNELEIARQLTLIEFRLFQRIQSSELLFQSWNKETLKPRAPNIMGMIERSNKISLWVASLILWFSKMKDRSNIVTKLVNIAQHVYELRNFNTLFGLLAGLTYSSISRLKHTWNDVQPQVLETLSKLNAIFEQGSSFKRYRQELASAILKGPVLPYLGIYLSDIAFVEEVYKDFLEENPKLINWEKRQMLYRTIRDIHMQQKQTFLFPSVEPIFTFLTELPRLDDKELYELSIIREPKGSEQQDIE